jgi:hypothetical protein
MRLTRSRQQKHKTLDEFYAEISSHDHPVDREGGKAMLDIIARLRSLPDERRIFGLTSHYHLGLHAEDSPESPRLVDICALDKHNYFVEYRIPDRFAPWPNCLREG